MAKQLKYDRAFDKTQKTGEKYTKALDKANEKNEWNKKERATAKLQHDKARRKYYIVSSNRAGRSAQTSANTKKKALKIGAYGIHSAANYNQKAANIQKQSGQKTAKNKAKDIKQDRKELNNIKKKGTYASATRKKTTRRK